MLTIIADLDRRNIELVILSLGGAVFSSRQLDSGSIRTILGGMAAWDHEVLVERQRGGMARTDAESRAKGRPHRINPDAVRALVRTMSVTEAARTLNISRSSAYRLLQPAPSGDVV